MKVQELAYLLDSFVHALEQIKGTSTVAKDASVFAAAFRPFADRTVADFTRFLLQCEEYQRTGAVSGKRAATPRRPSPATDPEAVAHAVQAVQAILAEFRHGQGNEQRIEETLASFAKLTKAQLDEVCTNLSIAGKARSKAQALDRIRQVLRTQLEMEGKVRSIHGEKEPAPAGTAAMMER
jgi:hypothetical protein